jgi:hypothetical protein
MLSRDHAMIVLLAGPEARARTVEIHVCAIVGPL